MCGWSHKKTQDMFYLGRYGCEIQVLKFVVIILFYDI